MFKNKPNFIWWRGAEIGNNLKFQKIALPTEGHPDDKKFRGMIKTDAISGCASIMKTSDSERLGFRIQIFSTAKKILSYHIVYQILTTLYGQIWMKKYIITCLAQLEKIGQKIFIIIINIDWF